MPSVSQFDILSQKPLGLFVGQNAFLLFAKLQNITQKGSGLMEGWKEERKNGRKFSSTCHTSSFAFRTRTLLTIRYFYHLH